MPSIKIHVFRSEMGDNGQDQCDYRGSGEAGAGPNDQHRTVLELDPADETSVTLALEGGPKINRLLAAITENQPEGIDKIAGALGLEGTGAVALRLGVWDK